MSAASAAGAEIRFGILKVVVIVGVLGVVADFRGDDLARFEGRAVVDRDDGDVVARRGGVDIDGKHLRDFPLSAFALPALIVVGATPRGLHADDDRAEAIDAFELALPFDERIDLVVLLEIEMKDGVLGDDDEQGEVDGVHAFAQDGALPAALSARSGGVFGLQEFAGILEVVTVGDAAQRLAGGERFAVTGVNVADLALRHRDERDLVQAVHPAPQAQVETAAQHIGFETGFIAQRDQTALLDGPGARPELFDDADAVVGDVAQATELGNRHDGDHDAQQNQRVLSGLGQVPQGKQMSDEHWGSPSMEMGKELKRGSQ